MLLKFCTEKPSKSIQHTRTNIHPFGIHIEILHLIFCQVPRYNIYFQFKKSGDVFAHLLTQELTNKSKQPSDVFPQATGLSKISYKSRIWVFNYKRLAFKYIKF